MLVSAMANVYCIFLLFSNFCCREIERIERNKIEKKVETGCPRGVHGTEEVITLYLHARESGGCRDGGKALVQLVNFSRESVSFAGKNSKKIEKSGWK